MKILTCTAVLSAVAGAAFAHVVGSRIGARASILAGIGIASCNVHYSKREHEIESTSYDHTNTFHEPQCLFILPHNLRLIGIYLTLVFLFNYKTEEFEIGIINKHIHKRIQEGEGTGPVL